MEISNRKNNTCNILDHITLYFTSIIRMESNYFELCRA